jgi:PAS domain S-box-containing protein
MVAKKKKLPEKNDAGTPGSELSLRGGAEKQLARSPKSSSDLKGQFPEALIHELRVHQIELETQAEELRKSKHALEESRDKYLDLYEFAPLGYLTLTDKALITEVNLTGATLLLVERSKLVNARFRKFIAHENSEQWDRYFINVLNLGEKQCCTLMLKRGENSLFPARLESIRLTDRNGAITVRVACSDISDVSSAEDALRESEERYRRITEGLTDYLYTVRVQDGTAISTTHNAACAVVTGYTAEEFARDPYLWIRMVFDEDRNRVSRHFNGVLKGKRVPPVEHRIVRKDGQIRWVRDTPVLQLDATGMLVSYDGVIKDITERKVAEEALQFTRHSIDSATETLVTIAKDGHFVDVNDAFCRISGYSRDELLKMTVQDIDPDYNAEIWSAFWNKLKQSGSLTIETTHRTKEKKTYPVETTLTYFEYNGCEYHCGFARDITERKKAEEALRESEEKYRQLVDLAQEGIWAINAEGTTSYVNPRMAEMLGYTVEEMHGRHLFSFMDDAGKTIAAENIERRRQGIKEDHEFEFITKEGDRIYTALATAPITDDDGVYKGALAVVSDITERKRAENALLRVNQKLNIISQLTRKDLANQIFVLNSYLELAKKQLTGQDHIIETVQKGVRAIQSIHETIEYSKDYQDMGAKPPKWQNVKMALLFGLSHISIGNIQHSLETENLEIFADPLLEKVCQRLFENSVKHGDHVTRIRVSHTVTPEGATIFFEDDGIGISAEKKDQIFLRDVSTGRASMRSLIFVREILDITGITIKETGEPGKGARFEMVVPKGAWRITVAERRGN